MEGNSQRTKLLTTKIKSFPLKKFDFIRLYFVGHK